jgi:hypothetical protein
MKEMPVLLTTSMAVLALLAASVAEAETLFEDDFSAGMDNWEIIGPGETDIKTDNSAPAGYGSKVLFMTEAGTGSDLMAFAKGVTVTDGFYEILWKDVGLPEDTDGPLWFRGQDEQSGPNTGNGYLVELDTDTGLHIGVINSGTEGPTFTSPGAEMSSGDWTWIKVRFEGPDIKVKIWFADEDEPDSWNLEAEDESFTEGAVGLRCWSGTSHTAYVRVSDLGGPSPKAVDPQSKIAATWGKIKL